MRFLKLELTWDASPWVHVLSDGSKLAWVKLLCYAKASGLNGRVKRLTSSYAQKVWMIGEEDVYRMEVAAVADGALTIDDGDWVITNWKRYQGDETAAERQKRHRDGRHQVQNEEPRNGRYALRNGSNGEEKRREEKREEENSPPNPPGGESEKRFIKPKLEEIVFYGDEIDLRQHQCEAFFDHFKSQGWVLSNGNKMKDWKAAMRNWKRNASKFEPATSKQPPQRVPTAEQLSRVQR